MKVQEWEGVPSSNIDKVVSELKASVSLPAMIILTGPVGAGKTTLAQHFAPEEAVASPTYSIINEFSDVAHADLYRLKDVNELIHLEIPLYLEDKNYFLVEWGKPFLRELKREVESDFNFYELDITIDDSQTSRNYYLSKI